MEMKKKNNSVNYKKKDKGKGKVAIEVGDDLSDFNEDEEGPSKKGHKRKELYQLISSIKQQTSQIIPTLPDLFNAQTLALAQPIFHRPLINPGFAALLNIIVNTHVASVNTNVSSSNVFSMVHPTHVTSRPQPWPEDNFNLSDLSLMSETLRISSMYGMPANILTRNSLVQQQQPWPANSISSQNLLRPHLSHSSQRESIPSKNLLGSTIYFSFTSYKHF
ncbi:hypothetical protein glysoja_029781 [Glycine soja]|uniref:Uncharacterized protein n=1 Tax=Glycine soja TaxID=3848 RepID=A0A0B2QYJ3_GLYSO|nr:hypothetical protein glysoja_029781 [Glycine soja]